MASAPSVGRGGALEGNVMARTTVQMSALRTERTASRLRKTRVVVKKVAPWSVFRFYLIYNFCVMLVVLFGLTIIYNVLGAIGVLHNTEKFLRQFWNTFQFNGGWLFMRAFAIGVVMVVFWSLVKLMTSFMYNLISDLVGGFEITLTERK
jgi:Transmembrane domain of unknown function (DUF3566)